MGKISSCFFGGKKARLLTKTEEEELQGRRENYETDLAAGIMEMQ